MPSPRLSILTISFNCWELLDKCLHSIMRSNFPWHEILIIDNASADGTLSNLMQNYPQVRVVQNERNTGFLRAVNQGFSLATGDRILLLDADTELQPDAVGIMSSFLDLHPDVCMVAPRPLDPTGEVQETARNFPTPINGLFGRQSLLTKLFPTNPFSCRYLMRENLNATQPYRIEMVSAACLMFRKELLTKVGMLDEKFSRFTGYWVDADWCKRIQKAGGIKFCLPDAVIVHHENNKPHRKKNPNRIIEFHTGALRFYRLHYTWGWLDPRSLLAAVLLACRCIMLLAINATKDAPRDELDPLSRSPLAPTTNAALETSTTSRTQHVNKQQ